MLLDLSGKEITGKVAEETLGKVSITVNKNTIPNETRSPFVTSGIRIGTPAVTSRGMGTTEMHLIAEYINTAIENYEDEGQLRNLKTQVEALAKSFPMYENW